MLFATATTILVVCATLIAAIPFLHAERQQRQRTRAMQEKQMKRARIS